MGHADSNAIVSVERDDAVALILINNPPVNASSQDMRRQLLEAVIAVGKNASFEAAVIACEGSTFVAGADIREFGKTSLEPILPDVVDAIEASGKPVVAAIHGAALGGGFEIALACHARIVAPDAAVGLPEVKLGLIPGAGGTQRLPRLVGMKAALDIIASGRQVKAREALALGIADVIAVGELRTEAFALARSLAGRTPRRLSALSIPPFDAAAFQLDVSTIKRKARGQLSPATAADAVANAAVFSFKEGVARERSLFLELMKSEQSKALRYAFFAERDVARVPHLQDASPRGVSKVGVIGAGTMGAGISVAFIDAAYEVRIVENTEAAARSGETRIVGLWERQVKSGRITARALDAKRRRVHIGCDFEALSDCDLIVEAAFEEMSVKKDIFSRLDGVAKPDAIFASNTSYLDVGEIADISGRPQQLIGLHFFSPAHVMRLVEIVKTQKTDRDVIATSVAVAKRLGKIPVVCGVCDGFVGNRILAAWRAVVEMLLEDGASPQEVDNALEAYGFAMGPFAVSDLSGLDIAWARRKRLATTRDPRGRYPSSVADELCQMGRLGQKSGAGWYAYVDGKKHIDPFVTDLIEKIAREKGLARKTIPADAIQRYVHAAIVNEGAKILSEGIAPRPIDIDVVLIHGYGFPAWRGGPIFAADRIGLDRILSDILEVQSFAGVGFEPAPLVERLAAEGGTFGDLEPGEAAHAN